MNCTKTQILLNDYIDSALSGTQINDVQSHLDKCESCKHEYSQTLNLLAALKNLPVPEAKAGYEKRVLSFLDKKPAKKTHQHNWFFAGFGSAVAASFALWLVFSPLSHNVNKTEDINTVNLLVHKKQTIDFVFNLESDLTDATLTIELPEKIMISGYAGKRQLSWKTSFKKGANRLALPLIANENVNGILIARLSNNATTKSFRVQINAKQPSSKLMIDNELATTNT